MSEPVRKVARLDKGTVSEFPPEMSFPERGRSLRALLRGQGIDPERLYFIEYYPRHHCWLLTQGGEPEQRQAPVVRLAPAGKSDEAFYLELMTALQRAARVACAAMAASSTQYARSGGTYRLPEKPQELTTAELAELLGDADVGDRSIQFDSEGRWRSEPEGR
jgi:hypothetical protein